MNTIQRITKNISVLSISQMVSYVLGFFTLMYSARYLGVEKFGTLSLALAFAGIFSICMDLGLSSLTIREVARDKSLAENYIANITFIKIILAIITLLIIFIIIHILRYNQQTMQVLYIIAAYTLFTTFSQLFYAIFQAHEKMEYQSIGNILNNVLLMLGVFLAIYFKFNLIQFSLIYFISGISIFIYALITYSQKFSLPKLKFQKAQWISLIRESWPFAVIGISYNLYTYIDSIILSFIKGQEAVGLYTASYKLILVLIFIPSIFNYAIFPLMSQYYISSKKSLNFIFEKLLKILILLGLPIGIGTVIIAKKVITLIYGQQFINASLALQILIWSTVLVFARTPFELLNQSCNKQFVVTKIFILGVIFNIIFNLIFIPKYSYIGAAIITVLTDFLVLGLLVLTTKSMEFSISRGTKISLLKIGVASLVMGITLNYLQNLNMFIMIMIGALIYVLALSILKTFDPDEMSMFKLMFSHCEKK